MHSFDQNTILIQMPGIRNSICIVFALTSLCNQRSSFSINNNNNNQHHHHRRKLKCGTFK